jgi:hypothetical protein
MNTIRWFSLLTLLSLAPLAHAQKKTPALPEVPEVLKELKPTLSIAYGAITLNITSPLPLTPAQWDAITAVHPTRFFFNGNALDDAGMARLVPLDPTFVLINKSLLTGAGVARFGEMKSLTGLATLHIVIPTPEAKAALSNHPSIESFSSDGAFATEVLTAPRLRSVDLKHGGAADKFVALMANHPALETLRLWPKGGAWLTDAAFEHLATISKLKKLTIDFSVLSYEGGLKLLKNLPHLTTLEFHESSISEADLAKLQADLPKVKITCTPMTPEYRAQWDGWAAKLSAAKK